MTNLELVLSVLLVVVILYYEYRKYCVRCEMAVMCENAKDLSAELKGALEHVKDTHFGKMEGLVLICRDLQKDGRITAAELEVLISEIRK